MFKNTQEEEVTRKLLLLEFFADGKEVGLLVMRVIISLSILMKHGIEKLTGYSGQYHWLATSHHYVSVLGVGPSLFCATVADGFLTILLALGLATRWAAMLSIVNLMVAWTILGFPYFDRVTGTHGELIIAYIASLVALVFFGGGKHSLDGRLTAKAESHPSASV